MQKTLGLDFGHCEVAMSLTMDGKKPENLVLDDSKEKVIPAQIRLDNAQIAALANKYVWEKGFLEKIGDIAIGNKATPKNDEDVSATTFLYFKKSPAHFHEIYEGKVPHGGLMAAYLYQLIEQAFTHNPDYLEPEDRGNVSLVVGCPTTAEWTSRENTEKYQKLIREATGIQNVTIVPESRAAMFSSIESAQTCVSASNGAIVFDFGSSTADCTYMLSGRRCIEFSWTLGAQEVEKQMTKVALDGQKASLQSRIYVTSHLRKQKEMFYRGEFGPKGQRVFLDILDKDGKDIEAYIRVNDDQMNEVVTGEDYEFTVLCDSHSNLTGPWRVLCRKFFEAAKKLLQKEGLPCENIVLTGGASKMGFIKEECEAVFGKQANILLEKNPSYSVANGLGWVSAIDARVPAVMETTKLMLTMDKDLTARALADRMAPDLQQIVAEVAVRHAQSWAEDEQDHSVAELIAAIKAELESDKKEEFNQAMETQIALWKDTVESHVQEAVNLSITQLMSDKIAEGVRMPAAIWETLDMTKMDGGKLADNLLKTLELSATMERALNGCIIWIFICIGNAIFPIIGALIAWLLAATLTDLMRDRNVTRVRNKRQRNQISMVLRNGMRGKQSIKNMADAIFAQLKDLNSNQPKILEELLQVSYDVVTLKRFES